MPESVVIVRWPRGYVAHVRYADPRKNVNISSGTRYMLNHLIDKLFRSPNVG